MAARQRGDVSHAVKGGIVAGLVGGVVLAIIMLVMTAVRGGDAWVALKGAGAPFLGARATMPGPDGLAVLVGLLCHFAVSAGWGALFGVLFFGLSRGATIVAGIFWGLVVWVGMYYIVLPLVGLGRMAAEAPLATAIVDHVIFGLAVAVGFLPFQHEARPPAGIGGSVTGDRKTGLGPGPQD